MPTSKFSEPTLAERNVPESAQLMTQAGTPDVVYLYTVLSGNDPRPYASAFIGKRTKATWRYRFTTWAQRENYARRWLEERAARQARLDKIAADRKAEATAFRHGYQPGDILYTTWGYDMINVNFFQVVATTEKTVTLRELQQTETPDSYLAGTTQPKVGQFAVDREPFTRVVRKPYRDGKGDVPYSFHKGSRVRHLTEWTGRPVGYDHAD